MESLPLTSFTAMLGAVNQETVTTTSLGAAALGRGELAKSHPAEIETRVGDPLEEAVGTLETSRADYDRIVKERGWSYHGNPGWHSRLIFRLSTRRALAARRLEQARRL